MVLITGAVSPSVIPFATTFSGPSPPPIQESSSPEITSPPIEEDISDPPIIPTALNLENGPRLVAYPMGTPDLEQVMTIALGIARNGAIPHLQVQFNQTEYYELIVAPQFPQELLSAVGSAEQLLSSFVQPALAHHQMMLGLHVQEISSLQTAVTNHWDQFAAYQQWIHSLLSLVSNNQRDSITSQARLVTSIERVRQSIPEYVRERLHEFHQLEQPWRAQVDSILNVYISDFKQLVQQLNAFSDYSFDQLQKVADLATRGLHDLNEKFDQERVTTAAAIAKLQAQINELSTPKPEIPPSPPSDDLMGREQKIWDAIYELRTSTRRQRRPADPSQPDPQVLVLTTQVAELQQEVAALREIVANAASPVEASNGDGCCPGLPGNPQIQCAKELITLANEVDLLKRDHSNLDKDVQEMSELIDSVNDRFAPCLSVGPSLTSRLAELSTVVTTHGQRLDFTERQADLAYNTGTRTSETLTTLEESIRHLWAQQPPSESEAELSPRINVLDSNNGGPIPEAHFKPTFKQVFDPKTSTIAAFLTIYETAMQRASDEVKKEHILTCLHPTCQEVVVPELPTIETWEEMKQLLIDEFGGDLSLEVKKDAFMHIAFKPKETLAEFADRFYMEGQQLITSRQLTPHEAYMACAQALKVNQLLCLHFKAHKAMLSSMKSIKTLLQDMHLTHSGAVVRENRAVSNSGSSSRGPCILTMNSQNPPRRQGCHNCGQIGHHSRVCTNPRVEGANPKDQAGKEQST